MNLLELRDVTRRFGGVTAVDRCSFSVAAGSLTGLIGPNGAGKTTVFNLIAGFVKPDAGEIELGGRRLGGLRPHQITRLGLSRTFQITRELKDLTVLENVIIHAPTRGLADMFRSAVRRSERERAMSLLDLVGLARFADAPARGLSFGQKKLLELAAALMPEPKLILLDEPAAGVNPALLDAIVGYIEQVNQDGVTFLIVEHNMDLVMNLCDPVIVMAAGKVLAHGPPARIQNDPRVLEAYLGAGATLPAPPRDADAEWAASAILASPSRSSRSSPPPAAARPSESAHPSPRVSESAPAATGTSEAAPVAAEVSEPAPATATTEAAAAETVPPPPTSTASEAIVDPSAVATDSPRAADNAEPATTADPVDVAVTNPPPKASKSSKARATKASSAEAKSRKANTAKAKSANHKAAKTAEPGTRKAKTGKAKIGTAKSGTAKTAKARTSKAKIAARSDRGDRGEGRVDGEGSKHGEASDRGEGRGREADDDRPERD